MIRALTDSIILRPKKDQVKGMVGLLHLPEIGKLSCKTHGICDVVARGPKVDSAVKVGGQVLIPIYDKGWAGDKIRVDDEDLIHIKEQGIVAIVC